MGIWRHFLPGGHHCNCCVRWQGLQSPLGGHHCVVLSNATGEMGKAVKNRFKCSTGFYMWYVFTCDMYLRVTSIYMYTCITLQYVFNICNWRHCLPGGHHWCWQMQKERWETLLRLLFTRLKHFLLLRNVCCRKTLGFNIPLALMGERWFAMWRLSKTARDGICSDRIAIRDQTQNAIHFHLVSML